MEVKSEERKISREVQVKLSQAELADAGSKAGEISAALNQTRDEFDTVKKEWKGKIGATEAQLEETLKKLKDGYDVRLMECREVKSFEENTVRYYRTDTDELVEDRAMTGEERQADMFHPEVVGTDEEVDDAHLSEGDDIKDVIDAETSHSKVGMIEGPVAS